MTINKIILTIIFNLNMVFSSMAGMLETEMLNSFIDNTTYAVPSDENLQKAQGLFESLLRTKALNPQDVIEWSELGFTLKSVIEGANAYAVINEITPSQGTGQGFYVIKLNGSNSQNIIEAPHRPTDLYTHQIIYKLFVEGDYAAAAWNTTNRSNVDFGKHPSSYYNAFTIAVAKVLSAPRLIQLHAFDASNIEIEGDLILSSTTKNPPADYNQLATCLQNQVLGQVQFKILQYPKDIKELGGTLNINAKKFYENNPNGKFYHVETSKIFRQQMRDTLAMRDAFTKCFTGS